MDVWVAYQPVGVCQCWRDAVCTHGWTWQEGPSYGEEECGHVNGYVDVCTSLADAVRSLYPIGGYEAVGTLLRQRDAKGRTIRVFVMRPSVGPLVDDHDAPGDQGPSPWFILERETLLERSTPTSDPKGCREWADRYRSQVAV